MTLFEIAIYETAEGKQAFTEWLLSMKDRAGQRAVISRLRRLSQGNPGDCQTVGDGVHELRIHQGPGYRVYFAYDGRTIVILLCGGNKSTQDRDIEIAKGYWKHRQEERNEKN
jgi:putative addiction module killer protein